MNKNKVIGLACDHAGFNTKIYIKKQLLKNNYKILDFGTDTEESVDYPDFAHKLSFAIEKGEINFGILFCGSGNGVNMCANKHHSVRSAVCWEEDIAELARLHNNANACAIPSRFISKEKAYDIVEKFLNTGFEGGRHESRVNKIYLST